MLVLSSYVLGFQDATVAVNDGRVYLWVAIAVGAGGAGVGVWASAGGDCERRGDGGDAGDLERDSRGGRRRF